MVYFALGLAVIGAAAGIAFRWKVLLPVIVLLPLLTIIFSVSRGLTPRDIAIAVIAAEAILQGGYFLGLLMRFITTAGSRLASTSFKNRRDPDGRANKRRTAPPAGARKGS
jgi:4-amino-4-deoxy-L-arabinose transferase-like glycosyltransferase